MSVDLQKFESVVDFITDHVMNYNCVPTLKEITKKCGISEATASKYREMYNMDATLATAKILSPQVVAEHFKAIKDPKRSSSQHIELWYKRIDGWNQGSNKTETPAINISIHAAKPQEVQAVEAEVVEGDD